MPRVQHDKSRDTRRLSAHDVTASDDDELSRVPSVEVDNRREKIVSMTTTRSGRRVVTRTETGKSMTQPVFFTPGGVVATETVPIYEAEAAVSMRSIKHLGKKRSGRK